MTIDWNLIDRDITCPLCEYNLRGLVEARCPECGHQFDWAQLTDPNNSQHPFLFEHGKTRRISRAFRTLRESLLCWRFWKSVRPTVRMSIWRLVVYWFMFSVVPLVGASILHFALRVYEWSELYSLFAITRARWIPTTPRLTYIQIRARTFEWDALLVILLLVFWPWLTLMAYRIFGITMRRGKIRWAHVVRVVVYSGDIVWMMVIVPILFYLYPDQSLSSIHLLGGTILLTTLQLLALKAMSFLLLVLTIRLCIASRKYLALPQAVATAVITQVIFVLIVLVVLGKLQP